MARFRFAMTFGWTSAKSQANLRHFSIRWLSWSTRQPAAGTTRSRHHATDHLREPDGPPAGGRTDHRTCYLAAPTLIACGGGDDERQEPTPSETDRSNPSSSPPRKPQPYRNVTRSTTKKKTGLLSVHAVVHERPGEDRAAGDRHVGDRGALRVQLEHDPLAPAATNDIPNAQRHDAVRLDGRDPGPTQHARRVAAPAQDPRCGHLDPHRGTPVDADVDRIGRRRIRGSPPLPVHGAPLPPTENRGHQRCRRTARPPPLSRQ